MPKYKGEYDSLYEAGTKVDSYPNSTYIMHEKYHGKLLASPRDFVFALQAKLEPTDGSIQVTAVSVVDPKVPVVKGYVRGKIFVNLYCYKIDWRMVI